MDLSFYVERTGRGRRHAGNDLKQRLFSGAVRSDDSDPLPIGDMQTHASKCIHFGAAINAWIDFGQVTDIDVARTQWGTASMPTCGTRSRIAASV
jgi:hypothetical protein